MPDPTAPLNVVAPDLSSLNQPGSAVASGPMPAPNQPAPPADVMTPAMQAPGGPGITPGNNQINPAQAPAPPAQPTTPDLGGHQKLYSIIQAIGIGLSNAGKSISTHGREGGAEGVISDFGALQVQKQSAQAAQTAKQNAALQQQLLTGEINRQNGQNYILMATTPDEITKAHLDVQAGQQNLAKGALDIQTQTADFMKQNWGLTPAQVSGSAPTTPNDLSNSVTMLNRSVTGAAQILGKDNPAVVAAQQVAANPNPAVKDILNAGSGLSFALQQNKDIQAAQNAVVAGLPKNQQEAAAQLAAAQSASDPTKIAKAQSVYDATTKAVQDERQFASTLQAQNQAATKQITFQNTLAQKGIEDTNKLWTDPQHGFAQTRAQVEATKNVVAQAKSGSELAASLEPAMTVLGVNSFAGVHRISPTEYEAAGPQVGSLYRRLNALLDKAGSGKVPPATLSEVNGIMDALVRGKYQTSLDSTRQIVANAKIPAQNIFVPDPNNFGTLTTLDKIPVAAVPTGNQAGAGVTVTDPRGVVHVFPDQASADKFKKLAGIK